MSEGFFERWSRRKQLEREGAPVPDEPALPSTAPSPDPAPAPEGEEERPPPTLADAQALTPDADFTPFLAGNVAPEVKNAAFRKLFSDPHFNVMDRMDVYIDDYSQSQPIPPAVLRRMASTQFLKLFEDDEAQAKVAPVQETTGRAVPADVAQSEASGDIPSPPAADPVQPASQQTDDPHADMRLQPDDAARAEDDRRRAG